LQARDSSRTSIHLLGFSRRKEMVMNHTAFSRAITPLRRSGSAEVVAEAIECLSFAEWTTGAVLDVDGGLGLGTVETYQDPMERRM